MGRSQISNALAALAGGLEKIANYRGMQDEKKDERKWQVEREEARNTFQTTLAERGYTHAEKMQTNSQTFTAGEGDKNRAHDITLADKREAAANKRHAESMAAQRASIAAAAKRAEKSDTDVDLAKRLKVFELQYNTAGAGYTGTAKAMNEEIKAIDENKLMDAKEAAAAKAKIAERYSPLLEEGRTAQAEALDAMQYELKMKPDFREKAGATVDSTAPKVDAPKVDKENADRAAQAAAQQFIASGSQPPEESVLVQRFMATGAMDQATAVLAARKTRSLAAQGRR